MTDILEHLRHNHRSMMEIMQLVERELALLDGDAPADLPLLHDALHYLINYAALFHHPLEERLFERLVGADASAHAQVRRLRREHAELIAAGRAFCEAVCEVENEVAMKRTEFMELANRFLDAQRAHREFEQDTVYPLARRTLAEEDWRALADYERQGRVSEAEPLFGRLVRQEHARLKSAL